MKTIGLCMIVKNEAHVIERCMDSVKRLLDYVLIVDTGSDDGTPEVIENWLLKNNLPGEVIIEQWKNFAYNRTFALQKLKEHSHIDYALMIDADEILVFDEDFDVENFKKSLISDIYDIITDMNGFIYNRPTLTSNSRNSRYEGVVHEFLAMDDASSRGVVSGFKNTPIQDGNRNRSGNKFIKDSELLEEALKTDINDWLRSRYTFYLAQSYRDAGKVEEAINRYLERSQQGFWDEEVYLSYYMAANLMKRLNLPQEKIVHTYIKAIEVKPKRAEAFYGLLNYCRFNGLNNLGYFYGKQGILNTVPPPGSLFIENYIYDYALLDEFSLVSYWSGNYGDSREACEKLLTDGKIPQNYYDRIKANLQFALDRLA